MSLEITYKDLLSIQQARELIAKAKESFLEYKNYSQEQVDKIVRAMFEAGYEASERLAKLAVEETGIGKWEDKKLKNEFATKFTYESIKNLKTVGVINYDKSKRVVEIAEPMGVISALIPTTNPTSTAMFKALICAKTRNALVVSPHPRAVKSTYEAIQIMQTAAEKAGAPRNLFQCMTEVTIEGTMELLKHRDVSLILATGSTQMVKMVYSIGKPAYGVGSGNVPAFIERTANIKKAVADIIFGKTFDYGTLCSAENAVVCDSPIREQVIYEFKKRGAHFCNPDEKEKLEKIILTPQGGINPEIVGKPAAYIAQKAGFSVPEQTTVLIAELEGVGKQYPLSIEKLSPILAFYTVDGWREGCHKCIELLEFGGLGHTMVIHSSDPDIITKFALEKPAFRVLVNTVAALGAVGYTTGLDPSMTLGPGTLGHSIISENVTARHLIQIKRLAYELLPLHDIEGNRIQSSNAKRFHTSTTETKDIKSILEEIEERIRLKAGNPPVSTGTKLESTTDERKTKIYGSGITEEEIEKIIRDFQSKYPGR